MTTSWLHGLHGLPKSTIANGKIHKLLNTLSTTSNMIKKTLRIETNHALQDHHWKTQIQLEFLIQSGPLQSTCNLSLTSKLHKKKNHNVDTSFKNINY